MRFLMWRNLFVVCLVAAACVAVTMPAWNGHKTEAAPPQTAVSPAPEMVPPAPETIPVAASDLAAMGLGGPRDEAPPGVPCLQTLDGFVVYDTIAKGKWSAFGWCGPELPNMQPCRIPYPPPPTLCVLPARPAFEGVIRDQCVWEDFWAAHSFIDSSDPPVPPAVDFTNYLVIAVVLGEREQCGWEVNIASIQVTDCCAIVRITECVQTESETRRINPFHFVVVPRSCIPFRLRVCFDHGGPIPIPEVPEGPIPPTP